MELFRRGGGRTVRRPETLFTMLEVNRAWFGPRWQEQGRVVGCRFTTLNGAFERWKAGGTEDDLLEMVIRRCLAHGRAIGVPAPLVGLMGVPPEMSRVLNERGYRTLAAPPEDLRQRRGALTAGGTRVDVIFRDRTLADLPETVAWKRAFRENRVVSTLAGEIEPRGLVKALRGVVPSWVRPYLSERGRAAGGVFATEFGVATLVRKGGVVCGVLVSDERP